MQSGLLWFDSTPARPLSDKIADAARRYREKFGVAPDTCYVNQAALDGGGVALLGGQGATVRVRPAPNVLPNHFWVGVEDAGG